MKKMTYIGIVLLIIQLGLILTFNKTDQDYGAFIPTNNFLSFEPKDIDRLVIADGNREIIVSKVNGKWLLPNYFSAPADNKQVTDTLKKLAALKQGLPVATTQDAAQRFKVGTNDFERHIILEAGKEVKADFFLGTSPGFKKIHARRAEGQAIISLVFNSYELEANHENWLDKQMLAMNKGDITAMSFSDQKLSRDDENWQLTPLAEGTELNQEVLGKLLTKVSSLTIQAILAPATWQKDEEVSLTYNVSIAKENLNYRFNKENDGFLLLKVSSHETPFKVASWQVKEIKEILAEGLVNKLPDPEELKENVN